MNVGKWIVFVGAVIVVLGAMIWAGTKLGIPFGKLPGDIHVEKEHSSLYFPIVTCLVVSLVLTLIVNLIFWLFRK